MLCAFLDSIAFCCLLSKKEKEKFVLFSNYVLQYFEACGMISSGENLNFYMYSEMRSMKKYIKLYDNLRECIETGAYPVNSQLPTECDLANTFCVSRQTVRQALELLRDENYVYSIRGSGSFVAPTPKAKGNRRIAVITTYFSEYIFPSILRGISASAVENGYAVELNSTNNSISQERRILQQLMQGSVAGVIVEGTKTSLPNPNAEFYKKLALAGTPIVFINSIYPQLKGDNIISVLVDDYNGSYEMTKQLLTTGAGQVGCIFKADDNQGYYRFSGMLAALNDQNIDFDDRNFLWFTTETKYSVAKSLAMHRVIADCDTMICYNDELIERITPLFSEENSRVKLLGSFDRNMNIGLIPPEIRFISLGHPKEKLGATAAQKLFKMISGKLEEDVVLPWEMQVL